MASTNSTGTSKNTKRVSSTPTKNKTYKKIGDDTKPSIEKLEAMFPPEQYTFEVLKKRYAPLNFSIDMYFEKLKESIIGQDKAIKEILFICYHNFYLNMLEECCGITVKHVNGFVVGPSGTGKTAAIQKIASFFGVPWIKYNATQLTSAGWVGNDVDSILLSLVKAAGGDYDTAQRGIIFIDEIDKKVSSESHGSSGRDINGTAVQEELLKIVEPSIVYLGKENKPFDTHGLTIICGGRFKGLEEIRRKRLEGKKLIGFSTRDKIDELPDNSPFANRSPQDYIDEDLIEFGFIDEFVGRFLPPSEFHKLSVDNLEDIIYSKDSMLQQLLNVFNSRGVDLIINPFNFRRMAEEVAESDTGARKLESMIFMFLMPALYDVEQNYGPGICEFDEDGNYTSLFEDRKTKKVKYNAVEQMCGSYI